MSRTGPSALALPTTTLVAALWVVVACGLTGPPASPAPTASPTLGGQVSPTPTASPLISVSPLPSVEPTSPPRASEATRPTGAQLEKPPQGLLMVNGTSTAGQLGSYCWSHGDQTDCVDSAGLEAMTLPSVAAESSTTLEFAMSPSTSFVEWSASYWNSGVDATRLGSMDAPDADSEATPGPAVQTASFPAPPPGSWVVGVRVGFEGGGDAIYGWKVSVP